MDFDGDGILDLVSGSYDPGDLYLFRGQGKGRFAAAEVIRDKSGKPILKVPDQKNRVESFGSWMALVDWNDRGVLDILVGTFDGMMFLRRNEGTRTKPVYSDKNEWVMAGNKRLRVPGGAHANPVIADWDGDGLWDILTGSADGGVYWYRNVGARGKPQFSRPVALVPKHEGMGYGELLDAQHEPRPGIRTDANTSDSDGSPRSPRQPGPSSGRPGVSMALSGDRSEVRASMTADWPSFHFNATHLQLHLERFGSRAGLARRRLLVLLRR